MKSIRSLLGLLGCLLLLLVADGWHPRSRVVGTSAFDSRFFDRCGSTGSEGISSTSACVARVPGFRPEAVVEVRVDLLPRRTNQVASIGDGSSWVERSVPASIVERVDGRFHTDPDGVLTLKIRSDPDPKGLSVVAVEANEPAFVASAGRAGVYGVGLILVSLIAFALGRREGTSIRPVVTWVLVGGATLGMVVSLRLWRAQVLAASVGGLVSLAIVVGFTLLAARLLPIEARPWVVGSFAVRLALVLQPAFPVVDLYFHTHNIERWQQGEILASRAPGSAAESPFVIPYPPGLYMALSPLVASGAASAETLVRGALALLEGITPLLVFWTMRSCGCTRAASGHGAAMMALMPEGVLVLAKGVAANVFGNTTALFAVGSLVAGLPLLVLTVSLVVALLGHFGTASLLLGLFAALALSQSSAPSSASHRRFLPAIVIASLAAWFLYYGRANGILAHLFTQLVEGAQEAGNSFFSVRWIRLGKMAQDSLLKFGLLPIVLACFAWRARALPGALRGLLRPWFAVAGVAALAALLTPVPLRFEYFVGPALAMAGGVGAQGLARPATLRLLYGLMASFSLSLGLALLTGHFEIISVILESPRWPFPFV